MKTLHLSASEPGSAEIAAEILKNGGIVAVPTETVYGLAASALDPNAVKKIFEAKGRPQDNPLIVHIAKLDDVYPLVEKVDERLYPLAEKFWPGPLTVIMKKSALVPYEVTAGLDTVAIRMPSHPVARKIIEASSLPLAAPSANASGKPSPTKASHVIEDLDGKIDAVIDGGECSVGVESTVLSLAGETPVLLRPGGISPEEIEAVIGKTEISHAVFEKLAANEKPSSPGMKYKHYAPRARVSLVKGDFESYLNFVKAQKYETCAVCFDGEGKNFDVAVEYGKKDNPASQAKRVFDALRQVDETGCEFALVRCPEPTKEGLAVYNRLLRSAAFRVIDLDFKRPVYGLTGRSGSGKSTVGEMLREMNVNVIDADKLARKAVADPDVIAKLREYFGEDIIKDGSLDRRLLAERAFSSPEKTALLNKATHPEISRLVIEEIHSGEALGKRASVIDAPVLFESDLTCLCKKVICVTAPENEVIKRLSLRDGITDEEIRRRLSAQRDEEYYKSRSDIIIENVDPEKTREKVIKFTEEELS